MVQLHTSLSLSLSLSLTHADRTRVHARRSSPWRGLTSALAPATFSPASNGTLSTSLPSPAPARERESFAVDFSSNVTHAGSKPAPRVASKDQWRVGFPSGWIAKERRDFFLPRFFRDFLPFQSSRSRGSSRDRISLLSSKRIVNRRVSSGDYAISRMAMAIWRDDH